MPLTPLHLAVGLPIQKRINIWSFVIVNVLIDIEPGLVMFFGMDRLGYNLHQGVHTFGGATLMIVLTMLMGIPRKGQLKRWFLGAFLGGYSHILLDAMVHHDVTPFGPLMNGNPLYLDAYHEVSITCAAILVYYLARWVESLRVGELGARLLRSFWGRIFSHTPKE